MRKGLLALGLVVSSLVIVGLMGCGQGATETAATTTTTSSTTPTTVAAGTVSISGQVAAASTDLVAAGLSSFAIVEPTFRTLANTGVASMTVTVKQVSATGAETNTGKVATTDASGNYTVSGLTPLTEGYYRLEATKTVGSKTLKVETLTVPTSAGTLTENIAPETQIAVRMVEDSLKDNVGSSVKLEQETVKEVKNLVVDDTEKLVEQGKINLPSNQTDKASQVDFAAAGIAENKGNANKAFDKLQVENVANNAVTGSNLNKAMKAINEMVASGAGASFLPPLQANRAYGQALLNGQSKTVSEVIQAVGDSLSGATLNSSLVVASFEVRLNEIQANYEKLVTGDATAKNIGEQEFLAFNESERKETTTASTTLDVIEQIALKNFIKQSFASGNTLDEIKLADKLGYLTSGLGISTNEAVFENADLYYASYGSWKVVGSVSIRKPNLPAFSGITFNTCILKENSVQVGSALTKESEDSAFARFRYDANNNIYGPTIATVPSTHTYQLVATPSSGSPLTYTFTLEVIDIPEPSLLRTDGTIINDATAGLMGAAPGYYTLPTVSDKQPVLVWSTSEVASISLPTGFSWAYFVGVSRYGTKAGASTLEVDDSDQTNLYQSGSDLGSLFTNSAFLSPVAMSSEVNGEKVAYKIQVQRVLLNAAGNFNGWAAGLFRYIRYQP